MIGMFAVKILSTDLTQLKLSNTFARFPNTPISSLLEFLSNPVIPRSMSLVGSDNPVAHEPNIRMSTSYPIYSYLRIF